MGQTAETLTAEIADAAAGPYTVKGMRGVLAAVILCAMADAARGDSLAAHWLRTTGAEWAALLGLNPERLEGWQTGGRNPYRGTRVQHGQHDRGTPKNRPGRPRTGATEASRII